MIIGIISILLWVVTIIFYIIRNLLIKTEKLERLVEERDIYINNLDAVIEDITKRLQEVDNKGTFASDDEVGFFFNSLKSMSETLNTYKIRR
jgi:uncharacterized membrane protein (DUF106 family)